MPSVKKVKGPKAPSDKKPGTILVHRLEGGTLPTRAYPTDAGIDFYASADTSLPPGKVALVPLGVALAIPEGYYLQLRDRSGSRFAVEAGVIDAGYRGPLYAKLRNNGDEYDVVGRGEKVVQGVLLPVPPFDLVEVTELPASPRGAKGFGSTGS